MRDKWSGIHHPPCPTCGGEVPRRENDSPHKWLRRKTCSTECRNKLLALAGAREYEHPPCAACGGPVEQREGEPKGNWRQRSCCSDKCAHARNIEGGKKGIATRAIEDKRHNRALAAAFEALFPGKPFFKHEIIPEDGGDFRVPRPETFVPTRVAGRW